MMTAIKFAKVRPTAIIPTKRDEDAGFDIYANFEEDFRIIPPHETRIIPSGIACACDTDYCLILKERGSTGTKGMAQRCGVIDSGYRGEIGIPITNTTQSTIVISKTDSIEDIFGEIAPSNVIIYPYEKAIAQAILHKVPDVVTMNCDYEEVKNTASERGTGKLGSTDAE